MLKKEIKKYMLAELRALGNMDMNDANIQLKENIKVVNIIKNAPVRADRNILSSTGTRTP